MHKTIKLLSVSVVSLLLLFSLVACGGTKEADKGEVMGSATVTIQFPEIDGKVRETLTAKVDFYEGDTLLDCTQKLCKDEKVSIITKKSSFTQVTSIDAVAAGDLGDTFGWIYTADGEMLMESAADVMATDGVEVLWSYADMNDLSM